jgi:hypothetical protein
MTDLDVEGKRIMLCGKTGSGKSQLLRYILTENLDVFSKIFLISPTEKLNRFYSKLLPPECIFDEFDDNWLDKLMKKISSLAESGKELKPILLIFDDVGSENDFKKSKALQRVMVRGRHLKISVFITCQYIYQIPPIVRNQCDYIMCGQQNHQSQQILCDEYIYGNISPAEFKSLYNRSTTDYNFFVINCNSVKNSDDLNEIYSSIKTPSEYL